MSKEIPKEIEMKMKPRRIEMVYSYALDGTEIFAIPAEYLVRYEQSVILDPVSDEDIDVQFVSDKLSRMVMHETRTKISNAEGVAAATAKLKDAGFASINEFVMFSIMHQLSKNYKMCFNCAHFGLYDHECGVYQHGVQDDAMLECFNKRGPLQH